MGTREDIEGREIFLFTNNAVSKSITAKDSYTSKVLYDLIVRMFKLEIRYLCCVQSVNVSGIRII